MVNLNLRVYVIKGENFNYNRWLDILLFVNFDLSL